MESNNETEIHKLLMGGYVDNSEDNGKLAYLHPRGTICSRIDTENLLKAMEISKDIIPNIANVKFKVPEFIDNTKWKYDDLLTAEFKNDIEASGIIYDKLPTFKKR